MPLSIVPSIGRSRTGESPRADQIDFCRLRMRLPRAQTRPTSGERMRCIRMVSSHDPVRNAFKITTRYFMRACLVTKRAVICTLAPRPRAHGQSQTLRGGIPWVQANEAQTKLGTGPHRANGPNGCFEAPGGPPSTHAGTHEDPLSLGPGPVARPWPQGRLLAPAQKSGPRSGLRS